MGSRGGGNNWHSVGMPSGQSGLTGTRPSTACRPCVTEGAGQSACRVQSGCRIPKHSSAIALGPSDCLGLAFVQPRICWPQASSVRPCRPLPSGDGAAPLPSLRLAEEIAPLVCAARWFTATTHIKTSQLITSSCPNKKSSGHSEGGDCFGLARPLCVTRTTPYWAGFSGVRVAMHPILRIPATGISK